MFFQFPVSVMLSESIYIFPILELISVIYLMLNVHFPLIFDFYSTMFSSLENASTFDSFYFK